MLPQSTQSDSRLGITSSSDSPRVYPCRRASGEGVTEAAEPELSVVPQYLDAEAHEVPECPEGKPEPHDPDDVHESDKATAI